MSLPQSGCCGRPAAIQRRRMTATLSSLTLGGDRGEGRGEAGRIRGGVAAGAPLVRGSGCALPAAEPGCPPTPGAAACCQPRSLRAPHRPRRSIHPPPSCSLALDAVFGRPVHRAARPHLRAWGLHGLSGRPQCRGVRAAGAARGASHPAASTPPAWAMRPHHRHAAAAAAVVVRVDRALAALPRHHGQLVGELWRACGGQRCRWGLGRGGRGALAHTACVAGPHAGAGHALPRTCRGHRAARCGRARPPDATHCPPPGAISAPPAACPAPSHGAAARAAAVTPRRRRGAAREPGPGREPR
jgi:hypothetical protein